MNKIELGLGGGKLLQVANRTLTQMMSYIIDTPKGDVIVIDGGNCEKEDAENLYNELEKRGKKVSYWFITHAHSDHIGAMLYLMKNNRFDIEIGKLCFNFPDLKWLSGMEEYEENLEFLELIKRYGINTEIVEAGDIFECGGVRAEILSVPKNYENYPTLNATSIIIKIYFPKKEALFLGDFDVYAQKEFLSLHDAKKLKSDIVQMAHHGQNGVDKSFYELIAPQICLYAAPLWLWENNYYRCTNPETAGMGPFTIMETRRWMEEIGALESYSQKDGDILFI